MSTKNVKEAAGISLDYGEKAGRVVLMLLTENNRGHKHLKGVTRKHLEHLRIPVDTKVLRLALNTGLVRVTHMPKGHLKVPKRKGEKKKIESEEDAIEDWTNHEDEPYDMHVSVSKEELPRMLSLRRVNFTKICQETWGQVSQKLQMYAIDLDECLFEVGSLLCMDRGRMCYLCPFTGIC